MAALNSIHPLLLLSTTLLIVVFFHPQFSTAQSVVKGGYWFPASGFPAADINSSLYTHLFCAFADLNPQTNQLTISSSNQAQFSSFTQTVQRKNPSVKTLLSIGGGSANVDTFSSMAANPNSRKSFIDSSIRLARANNFHGLDLDWEYPSDTVSVVKTAAIEKKETNSLPKSASSHTPEELEAAKAAKASKNPEEIKDGTTSTDSTRPQLRKLTHSTTTESPTPTTGAGPVIKPVRENIFILKDREEKSKEGKVQIRWDPLSDFQEKCPPGGAHSVVVYTTSLRGVRKTYEDCTTVSLLFEEHGAVVDERDVSLDSGLLRELKDLGMERDGMGRRSGGERRRFWVGLSFII